jgi:hypothetical protein
VGAAVGAPQDISPNTDTIDKMQSFSISPNRFDHGILDVYAAEGTRFSGSSLGYVQPFQYAQSSERDPLLRHALTHVDVETGTAGRGPVERPRTDRQQA